MKFALDDAGVVQCDVDKLIVSRMLVQANSGGGKSRTIRRVLEQTHGHVQQIVIDPEGEFGSLREKYDYVYAAPKGGDTVANPRTAALLAIRLLELGVSAIIDLYELPIHERVRFVKLFFEAMIDAPKKLWRPVMVVLDEAHVFAPEKGKGQADSSGAVIDMASRGRKRGFCAVYATQRIQKLSKDATADLNNKLIGRATQSADVDRAADEIGLAKSQRRELVDLEPGQFLVAGPAFNVKGIQQVMVGKIRTTHPEAGQRIAFAAAPPTSKIRALLPKLSDLPAEAEAEKRTVDELRQEVARLKREVGQHVGLTKSHPRPGDDKLVPALKQGLARALRVLTKVEALDVVAARASFAPTAAEIASMLDVAEHSIVALIEKRLSEREKEMLRLKVAAGEAIVMVRKLVDGGIVEPEPVSAGTSVPPPARTAAASRPAVVAGAKLNKIGREMLTVLAQERETHGASHCAITKERLAAMAGYALSGHFNNTLGALRTAGRVDGAGSSLKITERGLVDLGDYEPRPRGHDLLVWWQGRLTKIEREMLTVLDAHEGQPLNKETIAERAGYAVSGHFNNMLGHLRTLGLVEGYGDNITLASFLR